MEFHFKEPINKNDNEENPEDPEDPIDLNESESDKNAEEEEDRNKHARGRGRSHIIRSGLSGRPRKQYQQANQTEMMEEIAYMSKIPIQKAVEGPDAKK